MSLDFSSEGFCPVTREERISKCRAMAEEATMKAYCGSSETRESYLLLAKKWLAFAVEIEEAGSPSEKGHGVPRPWPLRRSLLYKIRRVELPPR